MKYKSDFMRIMQERGFIHQVSNSEKLDQITQKKSITAYIGFDCTAPSLHAGSLIPIMMLRWLQKTGHKPIILLGGGTTKIGDPSGKDKTREILSEEKIKENKKNLKKIFQKFISFGKQKNDAIIIDNALWLDKLKYIPFLREYGKHFTINKMLAFDSIKIRLEREHSLSFLEFNYMILQAYDFLELYRKHTCILQMGGSDQWGNIINGIELARKTDQGELFALTSPLLTTATGQKMGKTAKGAIWLNKKINENQKYALSPYEYWQYWRSTDDRDVEKFLKLFTEIPIDEIKEIIKNNDPNHAKMRLATEATTLAHGRKSAQSAQKTAHQTFVKRKITTQLPTITIQNLNVGLLNALTQAKLTASNSEARRLIKAGGVKINGDIVKDEKTKLNPKHLKHKTKQNKPAILISIGKKKHTLIAQS